MMEISYVEIIGWAGGSSVIISGIAYWIGQLYLNNRTERWRSSTESKLKILDSQLSEKSQILSNLIDVQKSNYHVSQQKRITSIENIWKELEKIKSEISPNIEFIYNNITEKEISELNKDELNNSSKLILNSLQGFNYNNFYSSSNNFLRMLFLERPFLGEDLYLSLTIYNKFLGRSVYLLQIGFANKSINHWAKDKGLNEMLKSFLPVHQVDTILRNDFNRHDMICFVFENKIIEQINEIISGKIASTSSLEQINIMKEIIKSQDEKGIN